jgi:hypothetical protein
MPNICTFRVARHALYIEYGDNAPDLDRIYHAHADLLRVPCMDEAFKALFRGRSQGVQRYPFDGRPRLIRDINPPLPVRLFNLLKHPP